MSDITLYECLLRDGVQMEGVAFSLQDKLNLAEKLDDLGIDYIEGGYASSNPKDMAFFREMRTRRLRHARIAAFGNTRRGDAAVEDDRSIKAILASRAPTAALVGKSWGLHVREVLRVSEDDNLAMIADSVRYLKSKGLEVFFDAEHFFDGYNEDPVLAMKTLAAAHEAGADALVLCDTNGGCLPHEVTEIVAAVARQARTAIGFHGHNDTGCAVANTVAAVLGGATHVQGCLNGFGERTGNADLCAVIGNLHAKLGRRCLTDDQLARLTEVSRYVYEAANMPLRDGQPYVGRSAFAHKGGLHVDAVQKNPRTYEHLDPALVGNERRILVSELSGGATIRAKLDQYGVPNDPEIRARVLAKVQELEGEGYQFEMAEASFLLLVKRILGTYEPSFKLSGFRTIVEKRSHDGAPITEATIKVRVGDYEDLTASEGDGPVNALDGALRKTLEKVFPSLREMRLVDYKVRIINPKAGTAARVLVSIESADKNEIWGTVGLSENLIEASWRALVDSVEYKLYKDRQSRRG
jgi:2-isopropylmalate synthase